MLHRVLPSERAWPLYDTAATRAREQAAQSELPPHTLMERAGLAAARLALATAPHARVVWVAAGGGNNGGDGLIVARHLAAAGKQVSVGLFGDPARLPADARHAYDTAAAAGVRFDQALPDDAGLIVDALLGIGAQQPVRAEMARLIERINACGVPVLALDLPSGLPADTGAARGRAVVRADHTLSLLSLKPGLFTADGRDHAGQVWFDDLSVDAAAQDATAILAGPPRVALRRHVQHKGSFGDVLVIGGAAGMGGAAALAARAASAAGAGRVFLGRLGGADRGFDELRPELMLRPAAELVQPMRLARATVVCGCGGGQVIAEWLPAVLAHAMKLVLDADALNAIAAAPALRALLAGRAARGLPSVVTPHPLEAARLLGSSAADVQADRLRAATRLAQSLSVSVLLKGSGTVIATPGQQPIINPTGNARLGSAGSGDVLAGWLGGLWSAHADWSATEAAAAAAWLHGRAAELGDQRLPLAASALVDALADALR
ncbi:NAD(P)H-hydrate dehydratase [Aquincola sp. S2]|uniref:Bifunctional NAD(P)H-hydrate repair enzyme n=1 Tax=Pseudaquabacterium terrae TaxID=2732868 RepID=A0ABX2EJ36_9BURK|nr:NAD(P)H-hydrate dehydratase [Aquabacterium terrae]NRF68591.1 NAD(P)H-hydrate dehydratase [Aquabacterium terrae]